MCWVSYKLVLCLCRLCSVCVLSCPTPCDPVELGLPGSSVPGILQARTLEWVATPSPRGSSRPRDRTHSSCVSCIGRRILYHWAPWQAQTLLLLWGKWIFSLYNMYGLAEPAGSCLQRPTGKTFTVTTLWGRWWKDTGLAGGHSADNSSPDGLHQTLARHFGRTVCGCECPAEARGPGRIWRQGWEQGGAGFFWRECLFLRSHFGKR